MVSAPIFNQVIRSLWVSFTFTAFFCSDYKPNLMLCRYLEPRTSPFHASWWAVSWSFSFSKGPLHWSFRDRRNMVQLWTSWWAVSWSLSFSGDLLQISRKNKFLTFLCHASRWVVSYPVSWSFSSSGDLFIDHPGVEEIWCSYELAGRRRSLLM